MPPLQSNVLLGDNFLGLTSTGLTMARPGEEVGEMDQPTIGTINAVSGVAGSADVTFDTSEKLVMEPTSMLKMWLPELLFIHILNISISVALLALFMQWITWFRWLMTVLMRLLFGRHGSHSWGNKKD
jgi:hypothetical protein